MTLSESHVLVGTGIAVGIPVALACVRAFSNVLSHLLFGVKPIDPFSFALSIFTMIAVALLAVYLPARRAGRIQWPHDAASEARGIASNRLLIGD